MRRQGYLNSPGMSYNWQSEMYEDLEFPTAPPERPYCFVNMVSTIDGKIVTGGRDESVVDLGSKLDHELMRRIGSHAQAVMLGAQTLRATPMNWSPAAPMRLVVTSSGRVPSEHRFLSGGEGFLVMPLAGTAPEGVKTIRTGETRVDLQDLMSRLRVMGIDRLLVLGGSDLNAQMFRLGLIDEIFLTLAPKIKLGRDVPTIADGEPLAREEMQNFRLLEHHSEADEVFLRYRRKEH
jgi:2,5-diamino-6-(ribosylamino)-4(3H)-pyrimidinone 5'-phosphate reductase